MYVHCIYVANIFTCVCRTLVPKICVCPEMLRVFWYIDVLRCVSYNRKQGRLELLRKRQVGKCADTWYKRIQPTEDIGAVAAWQLSNVPL